MNAAFYKSIVEFLEGHIVSALITLVVGVAIASWKISGWKTKVDSTSSELKDFIKEIREDIKSILGRMRTPVESGSPLVLNDLGKKIASEIEADKWMVQIAVDIHERLEDDKDPYEIQEKSFEYAQKSFLANLTPDAGVELEKKIRLSAYNNGLEVKQVLEVIGITLRDKVLEICGLKAPDDLPIPPHHLK